MFNIKEPSDCVIIVIVMEPYISAVGTFLENSNLARNVENAF